MHARLPEVRGLPTREQVWAAADRVLARGVATVTQGSVLAELRSSAAPGEPLGPGGTQRTVGPHLIAWKADRHYRPRAEAGELPGPLKAELERFAAKVWSSATEEAIARLEDERHRLSVQALAGDAIIAESATEAELARAEAERLRAENAALRDQVEGLRERLDRIHAEEFWDRVMQEAFEILPAEGTMSPGQILAELPVATLKAARLVKERLTEGTLRKKLEVRIDWQRFFEKRGEDAYARLPSWNGTFGRKAG